MKNLICLFCFLIVSGINAQALLPSNTYVRTCLKDIECSSINNSSYLFYDEANAKFYVKIDFNQLKTGVDSVDFWLEDLNDTYLYFKGALERSEFPDLSSYTPQTVHMDGDIFLNNIWHNQTIQMSIYKAQSDLLNNSLDKRDLENYRVNFSFSFSPKDFNVHKKPRKLTNTIFVGVGGGEMNPLKPGMENLLGEAYLH